MEAHNYNYYIKNIGEDGEEAYQAIVPKFPGMLILVDPIKEAHNVVMETIQVAIEQRKKEGRPIPQPDVKSDFKGKIIVRTTPEIHEKLFFEAKANQLSLNKYIEKKLQS